MTDELQAKQGSNPFVIPNKIMKPRERERERDKLRHKVYELV